MSILQFKGKDLYSKLKERVSFRGRLITFKASVPSCLKELVYLTLAGHEIILLPCAPGSQCEFSMSSLSQVKEYFFKMHQHSVFVCYKMCVSEMRLHF